MKPNRIPGHVVHLVHSLNFGGAERLVLDMALDLHTTMQVTVVCLDEPGQWAQRLRRNGVVVHCLFRQPGIDLRLAWHLARLARIEQIDIWHAHQTTPWFYAALSRILYPKPRLILEEHGRHYPEIDKPIRAAVNRHLVQPRTQRIIAVSDNVKESLVRYEGLAPDRIAVIYNGARPAALMPADARQEMRRSLGIGPEAFVIGSVGRMDRVKNYPLFLAAIKTAAKQNAAIEGLLIGDGPQWQQLTDHRQRLGLEQRVVFTGYRNDAATLLPLIDLFVLPSFSEGLSMALLEAMSAGIPAVVTSAGGNPEVVVHGQTGWIVPCDDRPAMAEAFSTAATAPHQCRQMGVAARARFKQLFSFDRMMTAYREIYVQLLGQTGHLVSRDHRYGGHA